MPRLLFVLVVTGSMAALMASAQSARVDSLKGQLETTSDPRVRTDILNELSIALFHYDQDKSYDYANQAFKTAEQNHYLKGKRLSLTLQGYFFYERGEPRVALTYYHKAAGLPVPKNKDYAYNAILMANVYRTMAKYDSAENYYSDALSLLRQMNERPMLAFGLRHRGRMYVRQWKHDHAERDFAEASQLYRSLGRSDGYGEMLFDLAGLHKNLGNYQQAQSLIDEGCALAEKLADPELQMHCRINRAEILIKLGEFLPSLELLLSALDEVGDKNEPRTRERIYNALGDVYELLGQNDLALRYYLEALKIAEQLDLRQEMGKLLANISWVYKNQRNFPPAFEFMERSLKIRQEIGDEYGVANSYNAKGVIYFQQKRYSEAEEWIKKSLAIRKKLGFREGVAACYFNLGMIAEDRKDFRGALRYQFLAYEHEKATGNKFNTAISYSAIGGLYTYLEKFDSARFYLERAEAITNQAGSLDLKMEICFAWSEYYERLGQPQKALEWYKKYSSLNDSLYQETTATKLAEMHALYSTEQKDKAITLLNQEKLLQANQLQLQEAKIELQQFVILFIVVALILVLLLTYKTYRYNQEIKCAHKEILEKKEELQSQSEELQKAYNTIAENNRLLEAKVQERTSALSEAYRELDTFFYRASHDFRRPLTTFLGLAEVAKITLTDPNARELFNKVRETAVNLDKMLLKLQSISDIGSQQLVYGEVDIQELFAKVLHQFQDQLIQKSIQTFTSSSQHVVFASYPDLVYVILENLVENSIAFCRYEGAFIKLSAAQDGSRMMIKVEDNGDGIEEQYYQRIFDMYFRGTDRSKGNGLGLYIIRKAVEKLNGSITFRSARDKGTIFILTFPLTLPVTASVDMEEKKDALVI